VDITGGLDNLAGVDGDGRGKIMRRCRE